VSAWQAPPLPEISEYVRVERVGATADCRVVVLACAISGEELPASGAISTEDAVRFARNIARAIEAVR
jgi:hypothetical protein